MLRVFRATENVMDEITSQHVSSSLWVLSDIQDMGTVLGLAAAGRSNIRLTRKQAQEFAQ